MEGYSGVVFALWAFGLAILLRYFAVAVSHLPILFFDNWLWDYDWSRSIAMISNINLLCEDTT